MALLYADTPPFSLKVRWWGWKWWWWCCRWWRCCWCWWWWCCRWWWCCWWCWYWGWQCFLLIRAAWDTSFHFESTTSRQRHSIFSGDWNLFCSWLFLSSFLLLCPLIFKHNILINYFCKYGNLFLTLASFFKAGENDLYPRETLRFKQNVKISFLVHLFRSQSLENQKG